MPQFAPSDLTAQLAGYVLAACPEDLPQLVKHEARRSLLNIVGCTIGGAHHEAMEIAESAMLPFAGEKQATIIGRGKRSDILTACLLNCLSSSVHTYDDTHAEAVVHPSGPILATILALAERQLVPGRDAFLAFVLGVEVICRLSKAISIEPARSNFAWLQTGITAGIGSAVSAGKLMRLDAQKLRRAIGIAASQAAGIRALHGSMCMPMMPAMSAQAGLRAALLAEAGFTASERSIEARYGFAECFAETFNPSALTGELGTRFDLLGNTYKPYPCGIVIHPIIDACLQLASAQPFTPDQVESIRVTVSPSALALTDRRHPKDEFEAQVSLYHWTAAAIVHGRAGVAQGSKTCINDQRVLKLRDLIEATSDRSTAADSADVLVLLRDGRRIQQRVLHCIGSREMPMSDSQLEAKFSDLAQLVLPAAAVPKAIEQCWRFEALPDAAGLVRLLGGDRPLRRP